MLQKMKKNYLFTLQNPAFCLETDACSRMLSKLSAGYEFTDIDYGVDYVNQWCWNSHMGRLAQIAANQPFLEEAGNRSLLLKALDRFLESPRVNQNWWHNEIGLPINCGRILICMEGFLSDAQREALLDYVKNGSLGEHSDFLKWTGANLLWGVTSTLIHSLFLGDADLLREPLRAVKKELAVQEDDREGIQPDYSFLQHYTQFYSGGYGYSFLLYLAPLVYTLQGTELQFAQEELEVLAQYLIFGMRYVLWGGAKDMLTVGRELCRPQALRTQFLRGLLSLLLETPEMPCRDIIREQFAIVSREKSSRQGDKYFSHVNYYASCTPTSHIGCRCTAPDRSLGETINDENFFSANEYAGGAACIMRDGREYLDIFPVFDFSRFPGTTAPRDDDAALLAKIPAWHFQNGANTYCGGMSLGSCGLMYQDLDFDGLTGVISRFLWMGCWSHWGRIFPILRKIHYIPR